MKLTIALVTQPSRIKFLETSLKAIEKAMRLHPMLHLLVIFNGVSKNGEQLIKNLKNQFENRILIETIHNNTSLPNEIVKIIQRKGIGWIHLPGDDDIIIPTAYFSFLDTVEKYPGRVAYGFSATAIDSDGRPTGKVLSPVSTEQSCCESLLVEVLHKPLFVWPSLIFNFEAIPEQIFSSRFVFDWWVGFQLLLSGSIMTRNIPLIQYRVHRNQESYLAPESRKRFEAEIMIQSVINSNQFQTYLAKLGNQKLFYEQLNAKLPIYADYTFGASIYLQLLNSSSLTSIEINRELSQYMGSFAASHGIHLMMNEFPFKSSILGRGEGRMNMSGEVLSGTCNVVTESLGRIITLADKSSYTFGCSHSEVSLSAESTLLMLDCHEIQNLNSESIDKSVLSQIEMKLASTLSHISQLAPWELRLVVLARRLLTFLRRLRVLRFFYSKPH